MKHYIFIILIPMALIIVSSCSNPSPEASKYIEKKTSQSQNVDTASGIVDVTQGGTIGVPSTSDQTKEQKTETDLRKIVAPSNLSYCLDQFSAAKKIWEKVAAEKKQKGESPFLYAIGDRVAVNGAPLEEMGGKPSPIPIFKTWETSKIEGIEQITTLVATGSIVEILSKRETDAGNWYYIKIVDSGIDAIKGWIPEKLLAKLSSIPSGNIVPPESQNFNPRGGGGRSRG